jgi:hypothetical protein
MKLTEEELHRINKTNKFIIEWCEYFADYEEELIFSEERIKEIVEEQEDIDTIIYDFPGESDNTEVSIEELLSLSDEIKTIKIESNSLIKTDLRRYYIVANDEYSQPWYNDIESTSLDGITINLISESFIVGLAATKLEEYEKDYWGTINQYLAVEIIYEKKENILDDNKEKELFNSYIFEVADSTGIALNVSEIKNPVDLFTELREERETHTCHTLRELESYNEGMKLFVSAVQIKDPELKFFSFYKVLELFSPIAVNIEANELMRKKLDSPKSSFEVGDFIRSIFELANSMRDRFNDEDLIKAAFSACFDFIGLYKNLPASVKKKIRNHLGGQELNYSTEKQKVTTSSNIAAKAIYKTRNKVVHAKSNFILTGDEIELNEMEQLNIFMKEACSQAIRWYSRQPTHIKLEIIK